MMIRLGLLLLACAALGGCAIGEELDYSRGHIALLADRPDTSTSVAVLDQRPYILNGDKRENFVGLSRSNYGIPFDVKTRAGTPMAADMAAGIARALQENGQPAKAIVVSPAEGVDGAKVRLKATGAERQLLFTLREWKTDTMEHTGLWFDVTLDVFDESGEILASKQVSGKEISGGSFMSSEKDAQKWFSEKVGQLLDNRDVAAALK